AALSQWCVLHRKRAKQVVETWDKLFTSSQKEQRVSFLYLANDILQNSRRKGSEYVNEFWKFLPAALKDVFENGDDIGKNAVSRLVDIWDERKVFGSRGRSLKDVMLGKDIPPLLENNGKSLNPIKIVKKDAHSIRIKLAVGGTPEKIVSALHSLHDEHFKEDNALSKCNAAVHRMEQMEKDIENASTHGNQQVPTLRNELLEQENIFRQCMEQLESVEASRNALVGQLKEALQEQVAQAHIQQATNFRQRLNSYSVLGPGSLTTPTASAEMCVEEPGPTHQIETTTTKAQHSLPQPLTSFATPKVSTDDDNKKAAAAAVAAKLAAMTSSAQMLSSVLSSLAAEEAASMSGGLKRGGYAPSLPVFSPEKRSKLEKPMPVSDMVSSNYFTQGLQHPLPDELPTSSQTSSTSIQSTSQAIQMHHQFPPPPPPPPLSQPPPLVHSYAQSSNVMMGATAYGYGANGLPPPPPLPTHMVIGLTRQGTQQQQQQQQPLQPPQQQPLQPPQPQQSQSQQQPATGGYYQSSGIGFYGSHQQPTPPLPRQ
ncbi:hypothetical protein IFM89_004522, partial [Coptis chinensis]